MTDHNELLKPRTIQLSNGNNLDVECSPAFIERIKQQFNLDTEPTDKHIRMFIFGSLKSALEKIEK
jgi:hypothetical protein